jgi:hypothetical protein
METAGPIASMLNKHKNQYADVAVAFLPDSPARMRISLTRTMRRPSRSESRLR